MQKQLGYSNLNYFPRHMGHIAGNLPLLSRVWIV